MWQRQEVQKVLPCQGPGGLVKGNGCDCASAFGSGTSSLGDGSDTGRRLDEDREYGATAEADTGRDFNRRKEFGDLVRLDFRRLPYHDAVTPGPHRDGRVDHDHMAVDQPVKRDIMD